MDHLTDINYLNFHLKIMSAESYKSECERQINREVYTPLLFTKTFFDMAFGLFIKKVKAETLSESASGLISASDPNGQLNLFNNATMEAKIFLEILSREEFPDGVQIIVLNLSHYSLNIHDFMEQLSIWKQEKTYPGFVRNMKLIDPSTFLDKSDYYIIDDHLNASGHRKVADALISVINNN